MQICFVTNRPAWPLYPGFKRRAGMVLQALAELGEVDVVMALPDHYPTVPCPPTIDPARVTVLSVPRPSKPKAIFNWLTGPLPLSMTSVTWGAAAPELERKLEANQYDVVWVLAGTAWPLVSEAVARFPKTRFVIDLDDLEDEKIRHRKATTSWNLRSPRSTVFRLVDTLDLRRWETLHQQIAKSAHAITVCSADDTAKLNARYGIATVHPVPNGYAAPDRMQTDADVDRLNPILLFVGDLTYRPNEEAARFLCEQVLPLVRKAHPTARVRLVGPQGSTGPALATQPGVECVGVVESIEMELLNASASCAPLLSGGGTRIKIIEAYAYGVPVVATTIGAEGLGATPGVELLIGDTTEDFAAQCNSLISTPSVGAALRIAARESFDRSFTARSVRDAEEQVLQSILGTNLGSPDGRIVRFSDPKVGA